MQLSFGQGNIMCCAVLPEYLISGKAHPFLLHPIAWNVYVMNDRVLLAFWTIRMETHSRNDKIVSEKTLGP